MCLAVPGKIVAIVDSIACETAGAVATVDFQGTRLDVSLMFTPEARAGDWVLVHAGFAINTIDEQDALETWKYLEQTDIEEIKGDTTT